MKQRNKEKLVEEIENKCPNSRSSASANEEYGMKTDKTVHVKESANLRSVTRNKRKVNYRNDDGSGEEDLVDLNQSQDVDPDYLPCDSDDEESSSMQNIQSHETGSAQIQSLSGTPRPEFTCVYCSEQILQRKVHIHAVKEHPSCVSTPKIQPSLSLLKKHFKTKDCVQSEMLKKCLKCGRKFVYWSTLMKHTCSPSRKQAPIAKCGKIKQYACDRPKCGKKFGLWSLLNVHQIVEHKMPVRKKQMSSRLLRKIDAEKYKSFHELYKKKYLPHLRLIVNVKRSFPLKSRKPFSLARFHKHLMKRTCRLCFKKCFNVSSKYSHLYNDHRIGGKNVKYFCSLCHRGYAKKSGLLKHMVVHNPPEIECQFCALKFKTKVILRAHVQRYHEDHVFSCEHCDKSFKSKRALNEHMKGYHSKGDPPTCPYEDCKKTFSNAYNLKVHIRKHTGEKPYACDRCSYTCPYRELLNQHMLTKHGVCIKRKRHEQNL